MSAIDDFHARTVNHSAYWRQSGSPALKGHVPHRAAWDAALLAPASSVDSGTPWAKRYRRFLRITDAAIVLLTVAAAYTLRFEPADALAAGSSTSYLIVSAAILVLWVLALEVYHTRDDTVLGIGSDEYKRVLDATMRVFGAMAILMIVFDVDIVRSYFALAMPAGAFLLLLSRWQWRAWLSRQRHFGHYLSKVLVVGERGDVEYVVRQFGKVSGAAYEVVGAALPGTPAGGSLQLSEKSIPVLCGLDAEEVAATAQRTGVNSVVVAGSLPGGPRAIRELAWTLECTDAGLALASSLTNVAGPRIHWRPVEGLPLMHVELPQFAGGKHVLKRAVDIVVAGTALLLLLPLFSVLAWVVWHDSRGPVFFKQERVGRNSERFMMYKFRSMVATAEEELAGLAELNEGAGPLFKIKDDPRITRAGRWLRKYSLDELPQLWNVLRGDMSLVGPRPPLPCEVDGYESHARRRLLIKPGITGLWQVNGRSNLDWDESVRLDLYYVENWSLTGDIMILWRTAKVVMKPVGAY
ncbi:polyprenyl glycosylphosphotransferase [Arthrobacter sp. SW1]|uniref:sugar transferase n=1 Tax=Arthrobacter sp. SW1 TaxID=1920889 RepID=UPI000877C44A|nr:sugar transferase [Arthrobacter sp. SW1]OFI38963.1 polyprenyl glycosylphosphotransferase [Arthrobacter sp. SW1]